MAADAQSEARTEEHTEEHRVRGVNLVRKIKEIIREGNVRRLTIRDENGKELVEVPLSLGVVGTLMLPAWAAIGALAALVTNCSIVVERREDGPGEPAESDESDEADEADESSTSE
ncbi:DUF4342 domain-containing protein [Candidatus Palauibacter sp.]|uniref:DUF4342 domain-containing protein n=1 Tax=Candidatus Palauibacter sp. TaxID=3101350 RepID=UPI003B597C2B